MKFEIYPKFGISRIFVDLIGFVESSDAEFRRFDVKFEVYTKFGAGGYLSGCTSVIARRGALHIMIRS